MSKANKADGSFSSLKHNELGGLYETVQQS